MEDMDSNQSEKSNFKIFLHSHKGKRTVLWLIYFLFWRGAAAVLPYISIYFESVNLSGRQIEQLFSIPFFCHANK